MSLEEKRICELGDLYDMNYYLENKCYCPGEIYDISGFFYQVYHIDDKCIPLCEGKLKDDDVVAVVCKDQILAFWVENEHIISAERYDATENNISEIKALLTGKKDHITLNEYDGKDSKKSLSELMQLVDAVICD